jgi:dTDP-4-amino-4,6-dideoxygalactose transaminase
VGVQPGEEVIVPPYTFTATATSVLMHNAIPVFADVEDRAFTLDPRAAAAAVTDLTRAIIPVHLFGHPADMDEFVKLGRERGLKVIEDCAQSPGARDKGRPVGTMGDCGIFSLTETKTITCGEGGVLVTNDEQIAEVARLVRNHGEAISAQQKTRSYMPLILGWNYRMTEIEAAIAAVQLGRLDGLNARRREMAAYLTHELRGLPGIIPPVEREGATHVYQLYAVKVNEAELGIPRNTFVEALKAEGIPFGAGYVPPLYTSPLYQERKAFAFQHYRGTARYEAGMCPVTERLYAHEMCLTQVVRPPATLEDVKDIATAFHKVIDNREGLRRS